MKRHAFSPDSGHNRAGILTLVSLAFLASKDVGAADASSPIVVEGRAYRLQPGTDLLVPAPSAPLNEEDLLDDELFRKRRRPRSIQVPSSVQPSTTATPAPRPGVAPAGGPPGVPGGVVPDDGHWAALLAMADQLGEDQGEPADQGDIMPGFIAPQGQPPGGDDVGDPPAIPENLGLPDADPAPIGVEGGRDPEPDIQDPLADPDPQGLGRVEYQDQPAEGDVQDGDEVRPPIPRVGMLPPPPAWLLDPAPLPDQDRRREGDPEDQPLDQDQRVLPMAAPQVEQIQELPPLPVPLLVPDDEDFAPVIEIGDNEVAHQPAPRRQEVPPRLEEGPLRIDVGRQQEDSSEGSDSDASPRRPETPETPETPGTPLSSSSGEVTPDTVLKKDRPPSSLVDPTPDSPSTPSSIPFSDSWQGKDPRHPLPPVPAITDPLSVPGVGMGLPPKAIIEAVNEPYLHGRAQAAMLSGVSRGKSLEENKAAVETAVQFRSQEPILNLEPEKHWYTWKKDRNKEFVERAETEKRKYDHDLEKRQQFLAVDQHVKDKLGSSADKGVTAHDVRPTHVLYWRLPNDPQGQDAYAIPEYVAIPYHADHNVIRGNEHDALTTPGRVRRLLDDKDLYVVPAEGSLFDPQRDAAEGIKGPLLVGRLRDAVDGDVRIDLQPQPDSLGLTPSDPTGKNDQGRSIYGALDRRSDALFQQADVDEEDEEDEDETSPLIS